MFALPLLASVEKTISPPPAGLTETFCNHLVSSTTKQPKCSRLVPPVPSHTTEYETNCVPLGVFLLVGSGMKIRFKGTLIYQHSEFAAYNLGGNHDLVNMPRWCFWVYLKRHHYQDKQWVSRLREADLDHAGFLHRQATAPDNWLLRERAFGSEGCKATRRFNLQRKP